MLRNCLDHFQSEEILRGLDGGKVVVYLFATSLAPIFQASRKAKITPRAKMYVNCGRAAMVKS